MKLRSGTWIDTVPDDFRSRQSTTEEEKFRNLWTEVDKFSPIYAGNPDDQISQNGIRMANGFTYQDILSRMMQGRPFSPVSGLYSNASSETISSSRKEGEKDRVRTRSSSNNGGANTSLFSTLKYDFATDKSYSGIPKLTICKRRTSATTAPLGEKHSTGGRDLKTKRLKLIVGKESFHIDLEK